MCCECTGDGMWNSHGLGARCEAGRHTTVVGEPCEGKARALWGGAVRGLARTASMSAHTRKAMWSGARR
eukprot:3659490-Prymnesium_polylepis.1